MAEVRDLVGLVTMRLPGGLGQRVRLLFALFGVLVAPVSGLGIISHDVPAFPRGAVAVLALSVAAAWAWLQYRRDGLPWWTDPVPLVALMGAGVAMGAPRQVSGLLFVLMFGRMLYGDGPRLWANAVGYFAAYEAMVLLTRGAEGLSVVGAVSLGLSVAFSAGVMVVIGRVIREHEAVLHREEVLARTGSRLQRAENHEEVDAIAEEMGLELFASVPGVVLSLWRGDAGRVWLQHGVGPMAEDTPSEVPLSHLPSALRQQLLAGHPFHLDREASRDVQRDVGMDASYTAMLLAPLLRGGEFGGVIAVASRQQVPADLLAVVGRLAADVGSALDRMDSGVLLHRVVENSSDAILLLDHRRHVRFASSAAARVLDRPPEALVGRPLHDLLGTGDRELAELMEPGQAEADECQRATLPVDADGGGERQVEMATTRLQETGWDGWVVNLRDVSERVTRERALAASEHQFRSLAENVSEGMYMMSLEPEPRFEYVNPAMEAMCGFPAQAFLDDVDLTLRHVHPEDRELMRRTRVAPDELDWPLEARWRRPDGEWMWFSFRETTMNGRDGRPIASMGIVSDITAGKRQDEALARALDKERSLTEELRRVDAMRSTFIQAVSHELRTPLTAITGYTKTLRRHLEQLPDDTRATLLERLDFNADKLDSLLADLLDVDRLSSHIIEPNRRDVDVTAVVRRVIDQIEQGSHHISCTGGTVTAPVDAPKIERIVENLVRNAIKHTAPGGSITVEVASDAAGDGAVITVTDDGDGIPEHMLDTIFEPFVQGPQSADAATPGMGIGLSLVARFVELHGGEAWVDNRPGGGAAFGVWLPSGEPGTDGDATSAAALGVAR